MSLETPVTPVTNEPPVLELPETPQTPQAPQGLTASDVAAAIAEAKAKWDADSKLSATELAKQQLATDRAEVEAAKAEIKANRVSSAFETAAKSAAAKDSARLMKMYQSELTVAENGTIENLSEIITKAKTEYPEMFTATPSIDAGSGNTPSNLYSKEQLDSMSVADMQKNMDAVLKSIALIK